MTVVTGKVDAEGRLIAADPQLLRLHVEAGGVPGGKLAIPQLATLSRLARNLGILVSRPIIAADGNRTLELLVRAQKDNDDVLLAIGGWDDAPAAMDSVGTSDSRAHDFARLENDGAWATDAALKMTRLSAGIDSDLGSGLQNMIGHPLPAIFSLVVSDDGGMPMLTALAQRTAFDQQLADFGIDPGIRVYLAGEPVFDGGGAFSGLRGSVRRVSGQAVLGDAPPPSPWQPPESPEFAERLDSALRGPIGKIISDADSINAQQDGPLRHDYVDYASDISSAGRHLLGLVDDLVDLQAIERPDFQVEHDEIDLADIARRAAGLLSVRASDRGVRIDRPDADEVLLATGEFRRVLQILVNLIGNAVRYSPQGSMVWIRSEAEGDLAAIIVADLGKGIDVKDQERIFEKFERVDPAEPGGSGLGLYIARRLARSMGGDITVDSAPGQGARFVLTLPLIER
jgi:two-component sensor histidine kinase